MPGDILSARFRCIFEDSLSTAQQQQAVDALKDYISELKHGTDEQRRDLGLFGDEGTGPVDEKTLQSTLERCYWQLVMFFRHSHPSRIAEAEPYLRSIFERIHARSSPSPAHLHKINAALYLAVALAAPPPAPSTPLLRPSNPTRRSTVAQASPYSAVTTPSSSMPNSPPPELANGQSREAEALSLFARAFALYDAASASPSPQKTPDVPAMSHMRLAPGHHMHNGAHHSKVLGPKTILWARAAYAALLRRVGRDSEAADVMHVIRSYITQHPYALPSEKYHKLLQDIERDFGITQLDVALSLETSVTLGLDVRKEHGDIHHVEDAASSSGAASEGESEDADDGSEDLSPILNVSPPSSSSESDSDSESSTESLSNSPITPSAVHFTSSLPHSDGDMVDQLSGHVGRLALSGSVLRELPAKDDADEQLESVEEEGAGEAPLVHRAARPYLVRYGAM